MSKFCSKKYKSGLSVYTLIIFAITISVSSYGYADYYSRGFSKNKPRDTAVVIIHGTLLPALAVTSPSFIFDGKVAPDSTYAKLIAQARNLGILYENGVMLEPGLKQVSRKTLDSVHRKELGSPHYFYGCYFALAAYDAIADVLGFDTRYKRYYPYGWSGILSQEARKDAGIQLYHELVELSKEHDIEIDAYSHGGNVALWLAYAEKLYKKGLKIDSLRLWATPIQNETVQYISSPIFKSIILFRSEGDSVHASDFLSTEIRESFNRMADLMSISDLIKEHPELHRCDVCLSINEDSSKVDHFNMFYLDSKSPVHDYFGQLPLYVVAPLLISQVLKNKQYAELLVDLTCANHMIAVRSARPRTSKNGYERLLFSSYSPNVYEVITRMRKITEQTWNSRMKMGESIIGKLAQGLRQLFT